MSNDDVPVESSWNGCPVPARNLVIGEWYWFVSPRQKPPQCLFLWHDECVGPFQYEQTRSPEWAAESEEEGGTFYGPIPKPNTVVTIKNKEGTVRKC